MTIQTLRNKIKVTKWSICEEGVTISYIMTDNKDKPLHLIITPIETAQGLCAIASIDEYTLGPLTLKEDGRSYTWGNFARSYKISQYEAIILVSRREAEMEEAKQMTMLELDEALKAFQ